MPSAVKPTFYLPSVDIAPYLKDPHSPEAETVIEEIRLACKSTGFFQLTGHGVSPSFTRSIFAAAARFFALPAETKLALDAKKNKGFRGYDVMGTQSYEADVLPDLKEGYISGIDIPDSDPRVAARRFFMGHNVWPSGETLSPDKFRIPVEEYYEAMLSLCWIVLDLVAATLPYGPHIFDEFKANDPACPLRLLHYPPTPPHVNGQKRQLGSSAHTDFGAVTLLLQDESPGLEVLNQDTGEWVSVPPIEGAFVVNMGDMISRITGGEYKSSVHRVVNKALKDRYSVVFFFDGNLDYRLRRLDLLDRPIGENEEILTVEQHMIERLTTTYGLKKE